MTVQGTTAAEFEEMKAWVVQVRQMLATCRAEYLKDRATFVLAFRAAGMGLGEIGQLVGVSRERIRIIEQRALEEVG